MFYPPLNGRQVNLLIQLSNINAAAMKASLSQINDPEAQRRIRDEVELLESTAEDLSEILGSADDTPTDAPTITPKLTIRQSFAFLDAIAGYIAILKNCAKDTTWDDAARHVFQQEIDMLEDAKGAIEEEL